MHNGKIYLIRHAQPDFPDGRKRFLGQTDLPLSSRGVQQAMLLAQGLAQREISGLYCSDLLRARETAAIIAGHLGIQFHAVKGFRELHMGTWENMTFDEMRSRYPQEFSERGREIANFRTPGGESFTDLLERVMPAFLEIIENSTANPAIIGHAGVNRVILCSLLSLPVDKVLDIPQDYAAVNTIEKKGSGFFIDEVNRTFNEHENL